jgi:regulatory protein
LDELEADGLLSDRRFAIAWMRNRAIQKHEGRSKLLAGLLERGIPHAVAQDALDEFFAETPEQTCCQKAVAKYHRVGAAHKAPLDAHLKRLGFTPAVIRAVVSGQPAMENG